MTLAYHAPSVVVPSRKPARPATGTCRLTLDINGTAYSVQPLKSKTHFATVKAFSLRKSVGGRAYLVAQTLTGNACDCPSFTFGESPKTCKHVRALVAAGLLDNETRSRLDVHPNATLAEKAENEADAYRALGTDEGEMFGRTMDELAMKIRMTQAATPHEYEARIEVLDDGIRADWEARGFEEGQRACCRCGENPLD